MKKTIFYIAWVLFLCPVLAFPQDSDAEKILTFESVIRVNADSTMNVIETIQVHAEGAAIRHGIYREFPTRYKDRFGTTYTVGFDVIQVMKDGRPESFRIQSSGAMNKGNPEISFGNGKRVYIGRNDTLLEPGDHTYTIEYKTNRQLGFYRDFDELYWNVTGNGWQFPILKARAVVQIPGVGYRDVLGYDAYTGVQGAKGNNFSTYVDLHGNFVFETTEPLQKNEGLTVVITWPKGYVMKPDFKMRFGFFMQDNPGVSIAFISIFLIVMYYLFVWLRVGRDPSRGTIIPLYEPPENLTPAAVRYIMKMGFDNKVFTSAIINMAVKKYITIEEKDGSYTLKRAECDESVLRNEEIIIGGRFFKNRREIKLESLNHEIISGTIREVNNFLRKNYEKIYFLTNKEYFIPGFILSIIFLVGSGILNAYREPERIFFMVFMMVWLTIWNVGVCALIHSSVTAWKGVFATPGNKIVSIGGAFFMTCFSIPFIAADIFAMGVFAYVTSAWIIGMLLLVAVINFIFYHLLKAPTAAGRRIMDRIEGFKMFLSVTEKERIAVLPALSLSPELFEQYLPFALALDVEHSWAEHFDTSINQSGSDNTYHPSWYNGHVFAGGVCSGLATGLASSMSQAISSSSSAPGSGSGSSGGGCSGGGGGGGGGGGW